MLRTVMSTNEKANVGNSECISSEAVWIDCGWLRKPGGWKGWVAVFQSLHRVCTTILPPAAAAVHSILCQIVVAARYYFFTVVYRRGIFSLHYESGQYTAQRLFYFATYKSSCETFSSLLPQISHRSISRMLHSGRSSFASPNVAILWNLQICWYIWDCLESMGGTDSQRMDICARWLNNLGSGLNCWLFLWIKFIHSLWTMRPRFAEHFKRCSENCTYGTYRVENLVELMNRTSVYVTRLLDTTWTPLWIYLADCHKMEFVEAWVYERLPGMY